MTASVEGNTVAWVTSICTSLAAGTFLQIAGASLFEEIVEQHGT